MNPLYLSGFATISSAGMRAGVLAERAAGGRAHSGVPVGGLYEQHQLPGPEGHAFTEFDVRAQLGRKGTSFYDRATALAVVTCGEALRDAGIEVDDENRSRIGVAMGTTVGSFKSTSDYSMETLIQPKPYLVNPVLFPNTVMNCAAGQAAIRYGLRGINATITGGPVAFLNALRYAGNAISQGYVDTMLVGAVEEFTPHRAWMSALHPSASVPAGEAAAVFAVSAARPAGRTADGAQPIAEVLAVANGFGPSGSGGADRGEWRAALGACVKRALRQAKVDAAQVALLATGEHSAADDAESGPVIEALGHEPQRLRAAVHFGDCGAATIAVALATVLELHQAEPERDGGLTLLTARTADGAVGAAIVRGWARGADRG